MNAVSFSMKSPPGESLELSGVLRYEDGHLILEWHRDTQFFPRKKVVSSTRLGMGDVSDIQLVRRWWKHRVLVIPSRLETIVEVPGDHPDGMLCLHLRRDQVPAARKLISMVSLAISQHRLAQAESWMEEDS